MEALRRPRSGISQTISIIAVILLISLSVAAFGLVLRQSSYVQGAQLTVAYQEVQRAKEDLRITIYPEYVWLAPESRFINMTRIKITSNWAGESVIDYVVVVKASGERIEEPADIRIGAFETVDGLKPSNLHPQLAKYDNDYNALANEVDYILFHTKLGNVFEASIGGSPTQKIIANVTSTTITQTSSITLTKVLMSTMTETKTDLRCRDGWKFIGWVITPIGSQSSKYTTYTISTPPLVGAVTVYNPGKCPGYTCTRGSTKRPLSSHRGCTTYLIKKSRGCGHLVSYWFDGGDYSCCTFQHIVTKSTSCTLLYKTQTKSFSCPAPWTKTCSPYIYYGQYICCCIMKSGWGPCVLGHGRVWEAGKGSNYIVVSYSLQNPGKIWFKLYWKPYYSIYLCSTEFTRCYGPTTPGCPPQECQEGATKQSGTEVCKCECVRKWYEPAKTFCDFCSWVCTPTVTPTCDTTTITKTEWTSTTKTTTITLGNTTTTTTVTPTTTTYKCVYVTERAEFSLCGPTTIVYKSVYTTRRGTFPRGKFTTIVYVPKNDVYVCTTKITLTPTYTAPTEMALVRPTPVAIGLILLGMIAYSPRKRRLELLLSILLLAGLILTTVQPLTMPVSASGCTVTETTTVTSTRTYTTTVTVTGSTATVTSTAPTATKTITTTIGTILIQTGYYYETCEYHTAIYAIDYCACTIKSGITLYGSCSVHWTTRALYTSYKGLTSTDVYTITLRKGTCPG